MSLTTIQKEVELIKFEASWIQDKGCEQVAEKEWSARVQSSEPMDGKGRVYERLDRFLANGQWCDLFPQSVVTHGSISYSDHMPIWLEVEGGGERGRQKMLFRFEAMWVGEEGCQCIINRVWDKEGQRNDVEKAMKMILDCGEDLQRWNESHFGKVQSELKKAQQVLQKLQAEDTAGNS
ncbi:hypothetical protein F2P56_022761 [Juglans regia]|uniref:Uncharacterized protein n=2 Tax=Juglans regia TaxID=51240 RepID=A0A833X3L2_JUGRE|nr:uncharacterized protein LOC109000415 [Juglans regia]KAF5458754.1 hypothetical protein F2P56_022761 [Juglans regia]